MKNDQREKRRKIIMEGNRGKPKSNYFRNSFQIAVIYGCSLRTCCVVVCMTQILHLAAWRPELESPTQGPAKTRQPRDTELLVLSS